jgi:transposase
MEVGTHSPWVSRLLREMGHEVLVANSRKLRFIYQNRGKTDGLLCGRAVRARDRWRG